MLDLVSTAPGTWFRNASPAVRHGSRRTSSTSSQQARREFLPFEQANANAEDTARRSRFQTRRPRRHSPADGFRADPGSAKGRLKTEERRAGGDIGLSAAAGRNEQQHRCLPRCHHVADISADALPGMAQIVFSREASCRRSNQTRRCPAGLHVSTSDRNPQTDDGAISPDGRTGGSQAGLHLASASVPMRVIVVDSVNDIRPQASHPPPRNCRWPRTSMSRRSSPVRLMAARPASRCRAEK